MPRQRPWLGLISGMIAPTDAATKVWTEAELESLPEDGFIHEVVDGELVMSPKNNFDHENIFTRGCFDGEHLLPGFRYSIADLFKEWDWE